MTVRQPQTLQEMTGTVVCGSRLVGVDGWRWIDGLVLDTLFAQGGTCQHRTCHLNACSSHTRSNHGPMECQIITPTFLVWCSPSPATVLVFPRPALQRASHGRDTSVHTYLDPLMGRFPSASCLLVQAKKLTVLSAQSKTPFSSLK